ncbi:hypothetical protein Leryth_009798 [Lithospermum erythrorhizon]|nr:hypothetical protein Leryth_009798 [Lithospermum erythrorhizon]
MAEILHVEEAKFWLPSEFLTDQEDILLKNIHEIPEYREESGWKVWRYENIEMDASEYNLNKNKKPNNFNQVVELTRQLGIQQKQRGGYGNNGIVGSPQSTLSQFNCHFGYSSGSSNGGSPNGASKVSSPTTQFAPGGNSLDLIYQAAAQVAQMKIKGGNGNNSSVVYNSFIQQLREEQILKHQQQHRGNLWSSNQSKNGSICQQPNHNGFTELNVGAYLENDQSSWPSLQYVMQKNIHKNCGNRPMLQNGGSGNGYFNSVKKSSAGTGVFLPRHFENNHIQYRANKKTGCSTTSFHGRGEMNNAHVSGGGCGQPKWQPSRTGGLYSDYDVQLAQKNAMLLHQMNARHVTLGHELGLPQEWTY